MRGDGVSVLIKERAFKRAGTLKEVRIYGKGKPF